MAVMNSLTYEKLKTAFEEAKVLRGLIPICARCKKIRNDAGYWQAVESYIKERSEADFTHGYCPECYGALLRNSRRRVKHKMVRPECWPIMM